MFFTFPENANWNADRQAVEFGIEIGNTWAPSGSAGACFSIYSRIAQRPSGAWRVTIFIAPGSR